MCQQAIATCQQGIDDQSINEQNSQGPPARPDVLTFTATATDPDLPANKLTFSLSGAPAGAGIDAATGVFTWAPAEAQGPASYTFRVRVTDNGTPSLFAEQALRVTVNEVNQAPVLAPVGDRGADAAAQGRAVRAP